MKAQAALLVILMPLTLPAQADVITWLGGDGNWSDVSKWSTGVLPGINDDVVVNAGNILLDTSVNLKSYTHNNGVLKGQGLLTVNDLTWTNGSIFTRGGVTVSGQALLGQSGNKIRLSEDFHLIGPCAECYNSKLTLNGSTILQGEIRAGLSGISNHGTVTLKNGANTSTPTSFSQFGSQPLINRDTIIASDEITKLTNHLVNSNLLHVKSGSLEIYNRNSYGSGYQNLSNTGTIKLEKNTQLSLTNPHNSIINLNTVEINENATLSVFNYTQWGHNSVAYLNGGSIVAQRLPYTPNSDSTGTIYISSGSKFIGYGNIHGDFVVSESELSLGENPGVLNIYNGSFQSGGEFGGPYSTINMKINGREQGVEHDFIQMHDIVLDNRPSIQGLSLIGTLSIVFGSDFVPLAGDSFHLISGYQYTAFNGVLQNSYDSRFYDVNVSGLENTGLSYNLVYYKVLVSDKIYKLDIKLNILSAVPEPENLVMMGLGLMVLGLAARRRKQRLQQQ